MCNNQCLGPWLSNSKKHSKMLLHETTTHNTWIFIPQPQKVRKAVNVSEWYTRVYHGMVDFSHRNNATAQLTWLMLTECFYIACIFKKWPVNSYITNQCVNRVK